MGILRRISARQRITLGLVGLVVGTLLIASALGFFPNEQREILKGRSKLCESLAIASTGMASSGQFATLQATLDAIVNRDEDVLSIGLRTASDELVVTAGPHHETWIGDATNSVQQMQVPVYREGEHWASLEICFANTGGILGLNYWAPAWLLIVMVPACFIQFNLFLRKSLQHLDPSDTVPQHVQDALDTLSVGLVLLDSEQQVLFANKEFAESIELDQTALTGTQIDTLPWQEFESESSRPWAHTAETGQTVHDRLLHLRVGGRQRTYSVNCSKVGKGVLATFEDITLLVEAREAAQQASESKSAFLANMSHEIRTPLNAVLGFTDVLRRGLVTSTEESVDHLNMIHRSGKHLLELINDILDLSKIEAGKMDVESIGTHVHQIIIDTADVLRVRAKERNIELNVALRSAIPRTIQSDPTRLKQIITNLVGNAIKFTEEGSVTIAAEVIGDPTAPSLEIRIIDTGIGMTPDQQARIFESFSQADETTTRRFGGTGLGLSISRRLAEALGGNLTVESEPGHGSTFILTHPIDANAMDDVLTEDEIQRERAQTDQTSCQIDRLPAKPVLVVDDGEANRRLIELVLGRAGAMVTCAVNGLEAIKALSEQDYDLVFMDMQMPVMDGYTATRKLREVGLETPIIALTGNAMKGDREKCMQAGCSDFLSKPVDIDKLLKTAVRYLGTAPIDETKAMETNSSLPLVASEPQSETTVSPAELDPDQSICEDPLISRLPMDDGCFREIVIDFVDRLEGRLSGMADAIASNQFEFLASEAHWLKGVGGTVGFDAFTNPAKQLENAAKGHDAQAAQMALNVILGLQRRIVIPDPTSNQDPQQSVRQSSQSLANDGDHIEGNDSETPNADINANLADPSTNRDVDPIPCTLPLDDPEFREIAADFVSRLDARLEEMEALLKQLDWPELASHAHWLKGAGGTVGYGPLTDLARDLETATKSENATRIDVAFQRIVHARQRLEVPEVQADTSS